jgi:Tfp pilus assembly protein FimT
MGLMELMITLAVLGIVTGITVTLAGSEWRRERVNTVAIELASWLEAIRQSSLRQPGTAPCVVSFHTSSPVSNGAVLATVAPASCSPESSFTVSGLADNGDSFAVALTPATPSSLSFSPRGSISATADTDLRLLLVGTGQMRCVRLTATLGLIRIGSNSAATGTGDSCTTYVVY